MRTVFKWLGILLGVFILLILVGLSYLHFALPNVGEAPDLKVEITPERVERGRYLANAVTVCMDCHSKRDWSQWAGPIIPGTYGGGG